MPQGRYVIFVSVIKYIKHQGDFPMSVAQNRAIPLLQVSGYWLMAISVIHGLGDIFYYFEPWSDVVRNGVFNAVDPHFDRGVAFWMLMVSPFLFALGQLCFWAQEHNVKLPVFMGWNLLITSAFGAFLMPISGVWLLIPPALLMLAESQQHKKSAGNAA
jgi:Family of unknown function (DUF6463)